MFEVLRFFAVECRAALYSAAHAKHSTDFRVPLYTLPSTAVYRVEGRHFTPQEKSAGRLTIILPECPHKTFCGTARRTNGERSRREHKRGEVFQSCAQIKVGGAIPPSPPWDAYGLWTVRNG